MSQSYLLNNPAVPDSYSATLLDEQVNRYLTMNVERISNIEECAKYEQAKKEWRTWAQLLEITKVNLSNSENLVTMYDEKLNKRLHGEVNIWSGVAEEIKGSYRTKFGKLMGLISVVGLAAILFLLVSGRGFTNEVKAEVSNNPVPVELIDDNAFESAQQGLAPMPEGAPNATPPGVDPKA